MKIYIHKDAELLAAGASPMYLGTTWMWFKHDENGQPDYSKVDVERIDYAVGLLIESGEWHGQPLVVDIENWNPKTEFNEFVKNLRRAVNRVKTIAPDWPVGIYSMMPYCDYWTPVKWLHRIKNGGSNAAADRLAMLEWRQLNDRIAHALASEVDFLMPSAYAMYPNCCTCDENFERWRWFAACMIDEAQRIADGREVIPIIMTHYGDQKTIEPSKWDAMIQWLLAHDTQAFAVHTYDGMPAPEGWRVRLKKILEAATLDHAPSDI